MTPKMGQKEVFMENYFDPNFTPAQVNAMSSLALALVGDSYNPFLYFRF